ncbi:MAG: S-layer homology domain-containing protein [Syntrophomonas sp.]
MESNTAYSAIDIAVSAVTAEVSSSSATLHFGTTGTSSSNVVGTLDIGSANINLGTSGTYTLKGSLTNCSIGGTATVYLYGASITVDGASIEDTGAGSLIYNSGNGNIIIIDGTLQLPNSNCMVISNAGKGNITIYDGTLQATGNGIVIYNSDSGTIEISGGTLQAAGNRQVIFNAGSGTIQISGGTLENTGSSDTITNNGNGSITVSGGKVYSAGKNAILNQKGTVSVSGSEWIEADGTGTLVKTDSLTEPDIVSTSEGSVVISGGTVSAKVNTICANSVVSISGGKIEAENGAALYLYGSTSYISGGTIISANTTEANAGALESSLYPGTIWLSDYYSADAKLYISGGTITNTAAGYPAIFNYRCSCWDTPYSSNIYLSGSPSISGTADIWTNSTIYASNGTDPYTGDVLAFEYDSGSITSGTTAAVGNVTSGVNDGLFSIANTGYHLTLNGSNLIINVGTAASGITASAAAKSTPENGKVMLTISTAVSGADHKIYYRVVDSNPSAPNVGDTITVGDWTENSSGTTAFEVAAADGKYIEAVETDADSKITKWGKTTATDDGYTAPTVLPTGGAFTDTDTDIDEITGTISWTPADPADGITGYKIYWGSDSSTILSGSAVLYTITNAATASQTVDTDTTLPAGANYFLVYSCNEGGNSTNCLAIQITDASNTDYVIINNGAKFQIKGSATDYDSLSSALAPCESKGPDNILTVKLGDAGTPLVVNEVSKFSTNSNELRTATYTGSVQIQNNSGSWTAGLVIPNGVTASFQDLTVTQTGTAGSMFLAVYLKGTGNLNISSGTDITLTSSNGNCIFNDGTGTVEMTAGTISETGTGGYGIYNHTGSVSISGGTVSASSTSAQTYAIYNQKDVSISGTASVSGGSVAVFSNDAGASTNISGGIITATGSDNNATAILMYTGTVTISGGTVQATGIAGKAIYSLSGTVNVTGGTIAATDTTAKANYGIYNNGAAVTISGGAVTCAGTWPQYSTAIFQGQSGTITISGTANITGVKYGIASESTNTSGFGGVYINGGTITATSGTAVLNNTSGLLTIAAGTIDAPGDGACAVSNNGPGTIAITGGSIQASNTGVVDNFAVSNTYGGTVNISGGILSSSGTKSTAAAIRQYSYPGVATMSTVNISGTPRILSATNNTLKLNKFSSGNAGEKYVVFGKAIYADTRADVAITGAEVSGQKEINEDNYGDATATASGLTGGYNFVGWTSDSALTTSVSTTNGASISSLTTGSNSSVTDIYLKTAIPAGGITTSVAAKSTPENGKVMLTISTAVSGADYKIYYRVVDSNPSAQNVGDIITVGNWNENSSGTSAFEVSAVDGKYIEAVEITTADNKITKWGKTTATDDGYTPVAASGITASADAKSTPENGKVMLTISTAVSGADYKIYYRVVNSDPSAPNVGDSITVANWTENSSGTTAFEVSAADGKYIEVVEITTADNKITKWGKTAATNDGYTAPYNPPPVDQEQPAPTGLTGIAPTSADGNDGKITGTTTAMEYKLSTAAGYIPVTGTEITGLAAGVYHVRYAYKPGYNASPTVEITVPAYAEQKTVPGAPVNITVAAGDKEATVSFSPPASDGGSPITSYTVISNPGNITATGTGSPITVTGLTNGTEYTFTVTAANEKGSGESSTPSNAATPTAEKTVPGAPVNITAIVGDRQAVVSFSPPENDGGSPITSYTVTSNPDGITATGTGSPITVTGLTNGIEYTFTVTATNEIGSGESSTPSNAATPKADAYTVTFNSNGGSEIEPVENIAPGTTITEPIAPIKNGYEFKGWYKNSSLTIAFNFAGEAINADTTLYAKWTAIYELTVPDFSMTSQTIAAGASKEITLQAGGSKLMVNGAEQTAVIDYTYTIEEDHSNLAVIAGNILTLLPPAGNTPATVKIKATATWAEGQNITASRIVSITVSREERPPCTCIIVAPSFSIDSQTIPYDQDKTLVLNATGARLIGDCKINEHKNSQVIYSYAIVSGETDSNGNSIAGINGDTLTLNPSLAGTYTITVQATAQANEKSSSTTAIFTVTKEPAPADKDCTCSLSTPGLAGTSMTIAGGENSASLDLSGQLTPGTLTGDCKVEGHANTVVSHIFTLKNNTAGAVLNGKILTVTRTGSVTVKVTATANSQTSSGAEATYTVTNADVTAVENQIAALPIAGSDIPGSDDNEINNASAGILAAKEAFENLSVEEKEQINTRLRSKLDTLINRLGLLQTSVDAGEDIGSVTASGLETAVDTGSDLASGNTVDITLKVESQSNAGDNTGMEEDSNIILESTDGSQTLSEAYNITLQKTVTETSGTTTTENINEADAPVQVTIEVPEGMRDGRDYKIYHVHTNADGSKELETIEVVFNNTNPPTITFWIRKFSTIVIGYTPAGSGGGSGGGSSGGGGGSVTTLITPTTTDNGVDILVNNEAVKAGVLTSSQENGRTIATVSGDEDKLTAKLAEEGSKAIVTIPINTAADILIAELNGSMIKKLEEQEAAVQVKTENACYTIPAGEINIDAAARQLGAEPKDIKVRMGIAQASDKTAVKNAARAGDFTIPAPALEFTVSCVYNDQTINIGTFNTYIERTLTVADEKITTGVIIDAGGTSRHVPTKVVSKDGKYYAVINSLNGGTCAAVYHPLEFADLAGHWAQGAVNDMGSRMVVSGVGNNNYAPDRDITRAEFAAIIVRALGLDTGKGATPFQDVKTTDWYSGYIKTANTCGIVKGYNETTFGPDSKITLEEAMAMIARAMKITGLQAALKDGEATSLLEGYTDAGVISSYARTGIAACLQTGVITGRSSGSIAPKDNITRAEVAAVVQRLLLKSDLIN